MHILLFDMDGVLLAPRGYHLALQETVARTGAALGFAGARLEEEEIAAFEAAGITSEWHSSAICASVMLREAWRHDAAVEMPAAPEQPAPRFAFPERLFSEVISRLYAGDDRQLPALQRAERVVLQLAASEAAARRRRLAAIIRQAHDPHHSLTHRIFQELTLGSETFSEIYGLPPHFQVGSYLEKFDRPALLPLQRRRLFRWLAQENRRPVILTSRPSRPPGDSFGTPEAEIGAACAGVGCWPILGWGGLEWLARKSGADPQRLVKPGPFHVLAALHLALGHSLAAALDEAAAFCFAGRISGELGQLEGSTISIFEDSPVGLQSLRAAGGLLGRAGIAVQTHFVGIATNETKRRSLREAGAVVYGSLAESLAALY